MTDKIMKKIEHGNIKRVFKDQESKNNLVGFFELLIEIDREKNLQKQYD